MKLDADVLRKILLAMEDSDECIQEIPDIPNDIFYYHAKHLIEANFIDGSAPPNGASNIPFAVILRDLTWNGHEFIKATIDESLWTKAKEAIIKPATSWSIKLLLEYLNLQLRQRIGLDQSA